MPENRGRRGESLSLEKLYEIEELFAQDDPIKKPWQKHKIIRKAQELGVHQWTLKRFLDNPDKLKIAIAKLTEEIRWQYFFEGMRLLSTSMQDLIDCMKFYIPNLNTNPLSETLAGKRLQLGSVGTFYNKALECFDTDTSKRTVRERLADQSLNTKVKSNLKDWPHGTVGIHTVTITWDLDHGKGADRTKDYSEVGGRMEIILLAERISGHNKNIAFIPIFADTTNEDVAKDIKEFLDDIKSPNKIIRMVMQKNGDYISPTTMDRDSLQRLLGKNAIVEEDVPTNGFSGNLPVNNQTAKAFKVKGRFESKDELFAYLLGMLNDGHRVKT